MKKIFFLLAVPILMIACSKNDNDFTPGTSEIDKLPPLTSKGANTIGCLINGKAFLPKGNSPGSGGNPRCDYMEENFMLGFFRKTTEEHQGIYIYSNDVAITQGSTFTLKNDIINSPAALFVNNDIPNTLHQNYNTTELVIGELYIHHLNEVNHTVSGTFWFNAVNQNNDTVKVREGRFDMQYNY